MKKTILFSSLATLLLAGCSVKEMGKMQDDTGMFPKFYASFDDNTGSDTKTYVDDKMKLRWTEDDRLSIFVGNTYNHEYKYDGVTGANNGSFSSVSAPGFVAGEKLEANYAVYPYNASHEMDTEDGLSVVLPSVQNYAENSFGLGANTMVAVTEDKNDMLLQFKNLCGYVVVKLYGEGTVKSIMFEGNDGEKISGKASVQAAYGELPSVTMSEEATTSITLDCGEGVTLGTTAETATEFWFCVPPVTFSKGFKVTVVDPEGMGMIKSMSSSCGVIRNTVHSMSPLQATFETFIGFGVPFEDPAFKAYCVQNFDTDGDGEISPEEAAVVTVLNCSYKGIKSLAGIELFTALTELYCDGNQLTSLDVSNNTSLIVLECCRNQLTDLDVSNNTVLVRLTCYENQLNSLDVSNNTALTDLVCHSNQLTSLDVSNNTALTHLACDSNQLTSLDVSNNTALEMLTCGSNQLTSLDVNNNTSLTVLECYRNQLTGLDVSKNTALTRLDCGFNQLTSLEVSNNTALTYLYCSYNQLACLDFSNNTALAKLSCYENHLTSLDVSKNTALTWLSCGSNQLTILDVSNNTALTHLYCESNQLASLDVNNSTALISLYCPYNQLTSLDVSNSTVLIYLECGSNQLMSLDVSNNTALTTLGCDSNQLTYIDISYNTALTDLECSSNQLTGIDVSKNVLLNNLDCAPMNTLEELYIFQGQEIPYVTINRSSDYIPDQTQIKEVTDTP